MKTALQRLLNSVHAAVFDKGAAPETAFRLRHANGAVWSIADRVMTVQAGAAAPTTHALDAVTVGQLVSTLELAGYEITGLSSEFTGLSALVLVEGSGDQGLSNGDIVQGYTSLLWALLSGYAGETLAAKAQIQQALRQMIIGQAEAEWLDLWGALYGISRELNEADASYAARIPREALRSRNNAHSIELAIRDATGYDVRIKEPWRDIFRLDESALSGSHKLYDGERIGYHLIQPVAFQNVDWVEVIPVINRNRAAGVILMAPQTRVCAYIAANIDGTVHFSGLGAHEVLSVYEDRALLDYSDISDVSILNHSLRWRREILRTSYSEIQAIYAGPADYVVHVAHGRDYRVVYIDVQYASQYWTAQRSWGTADNTWNDFNSIVDTRHSQSS